ALVLFQKALAQANALGRDFDQFIVLNELHTVLEREVDRWRDFGCIFFASDAEVGELLGPGGIDHQIVVTAMNADDHTFVHGIVGFDKHATTIIELAQCVRKDLTVVHGDQYTVLAATDLASVGLVSIKNVGNHACATS